jgi:hypothetical protein
VAISSINNATVDPRAFTIFEHALKTHRNWWIKGWSRQNVERR